MAVVLKFTFSDCIIAPIPYRGCPYTSPAITILNPKDIVDDNIDIKENFIAGKYIFSILFFCQILVSRRQKPIILLQR